MRTFAVLLTCALALGACGSSDRTPAKPTVDKQTVEEAAAAKLLNAQSAKAAELVKAQLKDPDSARFRNVRTVPLLGAGDHLGDVYCGEVNARNSMGGYTGFASFAVTLVGRQDLRNVYIVEPGDPPAQVMYDFLCLKDGKPIPGKDVTLGS